MNKNKTQLIKSYFPLFHKKIQRKGIIKVTDVLIESIAVSVLLAVAIEVVTGLLAFIQKNEFQISEFRFYLILGGVFISMNILLNFIRIKFNKV